jgi:hypothetical protein
MTNQRTVSLVHPSKSAPMKERHGRHGTSIGTSPGKGKKWFQSVLADRDDLRVRVDASPSFLFQNSDSSVPIQHDNNVRAPFPGC